MEEIILKYFNDTIEYSFLKVLDNKYRKKYFGVTLNYITYDLLKAKYKKSEVAKYLLKLHKEGEITSLFCPNVKQYVFKNKRSGHNFNTFDGSGDASYTKGYNLHTYLKQFIKNE